MALRVCSLLLLPVRSMRLLLYIVSRSPRRLLGLHCVIDDRGICPSAFVRLRLAPSPPPTLFALSLSSLRLYIRIISSLAFVSSFL